MTNQYLATGYNDVSWTNPSILSPNLDTLARDGMILDNSYVQAICTPTRAALMTGYYPIHTGRQVKTERITRQLEWRSDKVMSHTHTKELILFAAYVHLSYVEELESKTDTQD